MKKFATILVCLLLVASLAVTAFAADLEMTLTADKTNITKGDVVTLSIAMPALADCKSGGFNLDGLYDPDVFEFVAGDCPLDGTMLEKVGFTGGKLSGSFMYAAGTNVSGTIFNIQLKVKDTAPFGKTTVAPTVSARTGAGSVTATVNSLELTVVCANHTEKTEVTKEATCKEAGQKVTSCTDCGATIKTEEIAKLAHTEVVNTTKEATCKEAGQKVTSCSVCGETIKTEEIAKLPHTLDEGVVTKEATCAAAGEKTYTCSVCEETVVEEIAMLPHEYDEGKVTTAATTKEEGVKTYTCLDCGATKTESVPKLETPPMGDNSMIIPFVLLMILSAAGVAVTVIGKKRVA